MKRRSKRSAKYRTRLSVAYKILRKRARLKTMGDYLRTKQSIIVRNGGPGA